MWRVLRRSSGRGGFHTASPSRGKFDWRVVRGRASESGPAVENSTLSQMAHRALSIKWLMPKYLCTHFSKLIKWVCQRVRGSPRTETSTLKPDLLSLLRYWVSPIWYTSNTVPLRDEELALTVVAGLPFFFAGYSGYDVLGLVSCSAGRRTSIILYAVVRASGFPRVRGHGGPEVCKRPWSFRGHRGYAPMVADGWVCRLLCAVHQTLSLGPCTVSVNGAAGHKPLGSRREAAPCEDTRQDR